MALIEIFHVVAMNLPIDSESATDIPQGRLVTLTTAGEVQLAIAATGTPATARPIGIAGDSRSTGVTSYTPEGGSSLNQQDGYVKATDLAGSLILGAYGNQHRNTQNRVADNYNEVLASGKMTVYCSGGEFWTDQYEVTNSTTTAVYVPGFPVYPSQVAGSLGMFTDEAVAGDLPPVVGLILTSPTGYPSGVPGTGPNAVGFQALPEGGNSIAWGNFLHVKLLI